MKILFAALLFGFSALIQAPPVLQEQKRESQTISTEPKEIVAELKIGQRILEDVRGKVVFTPTEGNADDTLTGILIFKMSEAERKRIANQMKIALAEVPESLNKAGVIAGFERSAQCPELNFEFFVRHKNFDISRAEVSFGEGKLQFQPFILSFKESEGELSQMLCLWAKQIQVGRGPRGIWRAFTKVLKGKDPKK